MRGKRRSDIEITREDIIRLCDFIEDDIKKNDDQELVKSTVGIPVAFGECIAEVMQASDERFAEIKAELKAQGIDGDKLSAHLRQKFLKSSPNRERRRLLRLAK